MSARAGSARPGVVGRAVLALALAAGAGAGRAAAQARPIVIEYGLHGTFSVVDSGPVGFVAGPRLALRTVGGTRAAFSFGAGFRSDSAGSATARAEAAVEYVLAPRAAGRPSVYLGGGLAGVVGSGRGGYLLLYVGLEQSPGLPKGWALELGLGGGFRIRAAYHWRRFPAGWRPRR